jgi:hypothetical protein
LISGLVWLAAVGLTLVPGISGYIVFLGGPTATFLGFAMPALIYMKLRPVAQDFGDIALCGIVPNMIMASLVVALAVVAFVVACMSGVVKTTGGSS